jgi:hypothetical protein
MALIVPSSFHRIDAGLHALSFSPGFKKLISGFTPLRTILTVWYFLFSFSLI